MQVSQISIESRNTHLFSNVDLDKDFVAYNTLFVCVLYLIKDKKALIYFI